MPEKTITVEVVDYGDAQVNRLARAVEAVESMQPVERLAAFCYLRSRYRSEWPSDTY